MYRVYPCTDQHLRNAVTKEMVASESHNHRTLVTPVSCDVTVSHVC